MCNGAMVFDHPAWLTDVERVGRLDQHPTLKIPLLGQQLLYLLCLPTDLLLVHGFTDGLTRPDVLGFLASVTLQLLSARADPVLQLLQLLLVLLHLVSQHLLPWFHLVESLGVGHGDRGQVPEELLLAALHASAVVVEVVLVVRVAHVVHAADV